MNLSDRGAMELLGREAIVLDPYRDSTGVWTIGGGHTRMAGPPDPATSGSLSLSQCLDLFRKDVQRYAREVDAALRVPVTQDEFDALVSFHYNTGAGPRSTIVAALNRGDRAAARRAFNDYHRPAEVTGRRNEELAQFTSGTIAHGGLATVYRAQGGRVQWGSGRRTDLRPYFSGVAAVPAPLPKVTKTEAVGAVTGVGAVGAAAWKWAGIHPWEVGLSAVIVVALAAIVWKWRRR